MRGSDNAYVTPDVAIVTLENVRFHGDSFDFYSGRVNRSGNTFLTPIPSGLVINE